MRANPQDLSIDLIVQLSRQFNYELELRFTTHTGIEECILHLQRGLQSLATPKSELMEAGRHTENRSTIALIRTTKYSEAGPDHLLWSLF